jgi:hypothetical protein
MRLLAWLRHRSVDDTVFPYVERSGVGRPPAGPYLILDREGPVLGTAGKAPTGGSQRLLTVNVH